MMMERKGGGVEEKKGKGLGPKNGPDAVVAGGAKDGGKKQTRNVRDEIGRDKGKEEHSAVENVEASSVADASGSPVGVPEAKPSKRKRAGDANGSAAHATSKRPKVETAESAADQPAQKASSRRSARAFTQQEKRAGPSSSAAKSMKAKPAQNQTGGSKRSVKSGDAAGKELGTLEEYRDLRLRLEKLRHSQVYEGEKRRLYAQMLVKLNYDYEVRLAEDEFEAARRLLAQRLLQENMEHQRRVEELRYKILRDEYQNGVWQRRHEMSLRGRHAKDAAATATADGAHGGGGQGLKFDADAIYPDPQNDKGASRNRRRISIDRARVRVELDAVEVMDDLAEIIGEKHSQAESAGAGGEAR